MDKHIKEVKNDKSPYDLKFDSYNERKPWFDLNNETDYGERNPGFDSKNETDHGERKPKFDSKSETYHSVEEEKDGKTCND